MGINSDVTRQLEKAISNIGKELNQVPNSNFMTKIGEEAARLIYVRTKLGYGVTKTGSPRTKLKTLSPFYVALRNTIKKGNKVAIKKKYQQLGYKMPNPLPTLSDTTTPKKSNLTFTGQLLSSIKVISSKNFTVVVGPKGYRKDGLSNEEVANRVQKNGRSFLFMSDLEIKKLKRYAANSFNSIFKDRIKKFK